VIRILNFLYYISYAYIVIYGCVFPFYFDQSTLTLNFKIVTSIFVGVAVVITIAKQVLDKKKERELQEEEVFDRQEIKSGVNSLSNQQRIEETEKRENLKTTKDYLRYGMMQVDDINHNLRIIARNSSIYHNFILLYFEQVEKIPCFFSQNEWEDTELEIYDSMVNRINEYFNLAGMFESSARKKQLEILKKEREKLLTAKRREFANKK
jgi:hypothetical protein